MASVAGRLMGGFPGGPASECQGARVRALYTTRSIKIELRRRGITGRHESLGSRPACGARTKRKRKGQQRGLQRFGYHGVERPGLPSSFCVASGCPPFTNAGNHSDLAIESRSSGSNTDRLAALRFDCRDGSRVAKGLESGTFFPTARRDNPQQDYL